MLWEKLNFKGIAKQIQTLFFYILNPEICSQGLIKYKWPNGLKGATSKLYRLNLLI